METPFDSLIARLWRQIFKSYHRNSSVSEELSLAMTFARIARVLYVNIAVASEKMLAQTYSRSNQSGSRIITLEEMRELEDGPIQCKLSYMHFIEHVNRTARAFKRKGFQPPPLARLYPLAGQKRKGRVSFSSTY
jgi:hypothetical protein